MAIDQQVLGYLLSFLSKEILTQVVTMKTAAQAWRAIEDMFASQISARVVNTRLTLATAQKGNTDVAEYIEKMKVLGDEMASTGKPLDDEEMVSYILAGLDIDFNPLVAALVSRVEPI